MKEKKQHRTRKEREKTQKSVLTVFFINSDCLGCDPATSLEDRSLWGAHIVDFLLELTYFESGEKRLPGQSFSSFPLGNSPLLGFCVQTDWSDARTGFFVMRDDEPPLTSDFLFLQNQKGNWIAPGEHDNSSDFFPMMALLGPNEFHQEQISMPMEKAAKAHYLPRDRFDLFVKFLLKWLLESLRARSLNNKSDPSVVCKGDNYFTQWLSSTVSMKWTQEEFKKVYFLLMDWANLTLHKNKKDLLQLFKFFHHDEVEQVLPDPFSFSEEEKQSNSQGQSETQKSTLTEESTLLATIRENSQLVKKEQERYRQLWAKCENETLSEDELTEYQALLSQLEARNLKRIEALITLAQSRGKTLGEVTAELDFKEGNDAF